jgi:hypothetical protein
MKSSALQPTLRDGNAAKSSSSSSVSISSCAKTVKATNRDLTRTSTNVSHVSNSCKCPVCCFNCFKMPFPLFQNFFVVCSEMEASFYQRCSLILTSNSSFLSHNSKLWSTLSNTVKTSQMSDSSVCLRSYQW